jgi:hypothetical protein
MYSEQWLRGVTPIFAVWMGAIHAGLMGRICRLVRDSYGSLTAIVVNQGSDSPTGA